MVRRRTGKARAAQSKSRGVDRRDSKIKRWNKASDVPLDEEDQFHASRDRILLEGDASGGGEEEEGDEDEVFALKGIAEDESEEEEEVNYGSDDDDGMDGAHDAAAAATEKERKKKKKGKGTEKEKGKGNKRKKDEDEDEERSSDEEEEGWGTKKSAYYASNAEQIESDDEEANELEEQEARRLQAKARDTMEDDDFGLGDMVEGPAERDGLVEEPAEPVVQPLPQDKHSLLRHLEKTNPEALALANDWEDVAYTLVKTKAKIDKLQTNDPASLALSMMHLHYQGLLTYATTLAFYLHLRVSEKYVQRPELLRTHPIMIRLLTLKESLKTMEDLDFAASDDDDDEEDDEDEDDIPDWMADAPDLLAGNKTLRKKLKGLEKGELQALLLEASRHMNLDDLPSSSPPSSPPKLSIKIKRKAKTDDPAPEPPSKKRKAADATPKPIMPVFDLVEPELAPSGPQKKKKSKPSGDKGTTGSAPAPTPVDDVYGEATALDVADATDKQARKKSLRFHVSRIEGTSARRAGARAGALGGDDDIPYRERKKEREARLAKEVAKAREAVRGDDLDDVDPELEALEPGASARAKQGKTRRRDEEDESGSNEDGGGEDGYYELVRRQSKVKKDKKKQEYEAASAAARHFDDEETVDGPRSLTHAILKNKGLTPKRSKSVRNPRVKKRERYEKAKKKVSSQKAIYKGGVDVSRYSGERTGISQTVKGIRL